MSPWKKIRYQLEWLICTTLVSGVPLVSRRVCVFVAKLLGTLAFRVDARGRAISLANLEVAFGDRFTPQQRANIARQSYQTFIGTMLSLFWARRMTRENYTQFIEIENAGHLYA